MTGSMKFSVVMEAITAQWNSAIKAAASTFTTAIGGMKRTSAEAAASGQAIYAALNQKPGGALRAEIDHINAALKAFRAHAGAPASEVARVTAAAKSHIADLKAQLGGVGVAGERSALGLRTIIGPLIAIGGAAGGLYAVQQGLAAIVAATVKFDAVNQQLKFAFDGAEAAGREFEFVKNIATELGLELQSAAKGYASLASATKGTRLEGEATRVLFHGIASAAAAMHLSVEDTNGVLTAIGQIASKGKVSMEELRGQLGERLPPAMQIAAKSMGVTVEELNQLVESGIDATTFLKSFGPALVEAFSPTAADNAKTLQGSITLLSNAVQLFLRDLSSSGVGAGIATVLTDVRSAIERLQSSLNQLDRATVDAVKEAFSQLYAVLQQVAAVALSAFADVGAALNSLVDSARSVLGAFTELGSSRDDVNLLTRAFQGLSILVGTVKDGVTALGIAFTVVAGGVQQLLSGIATGLSKLTFGDLSRQMGELAKQLDASARESFDKAEKAALGFQSAAVAALDKAANAAVESARVSGDAHKAAAGKAAEAVAEVGKASLGVTEIVRLQGFKAAEAVVNIQKSANLAAGAFAELAKAVGVTLPPSVRTVNDFGYAMGQVAAASSKTADVIMRELPEAVGKLNGADLAQFQTAFVDGLRKAGANADTLREAVVTMAEVGVKALGGDLAAALRKPTEEFQHLRRVVDVLVEGLGELRQAGVDTNIALSQALGGMLEKARNPAELRSLVELWRKLGDEGKITGEALKAGLQAALDKLDDMTPGINSFAEAFRRLGVQTRETSSKMAAEFGQAFDMISASGNATRADLVEAFRRYAEAAVSANDGVISDLVRVRAAANQISVALDESGRVIVQTYEEAVRQTNRLIEAQDRSGYAGEYAANRTTTALERQIDAEERLIGLKERQAELERRKAGVDREGFVTDKSGQRLSMGGQSWLGIVNQLKAYGLDESAARGVARQFTDSQGNVPYFNNPGQIAMSASTLSEAILKAAERYLMSHPPDDGNAPGRIPNYTMPPTYAPVQRMDAAGLQQAASTQVIEFRAGREKVSLTGDSTSADKIVELLRQAGAVNVTRIGG